MQDQYGIPWLCKARGNDKNNGSQGLDKDKGNDVRKQLSGSLESFADENHAQLSSDISNDHGLAEQSDRSELEQSFGKNDQNCAQTVDPNDTNDTLHTSQEGSPSYEGAEYGAKIREELRRLTSKEN